MVYKWAFVRPAYWHGLILGTIFIFSESACSGTCLSLALFTPLSMCCVPGDRGGDRWSGSPITLRVLASWFGVIHCGVAGLVLKLSPTTHAHRTQYPGRGEVALPVFRLEAEIVDSQGLGLFCSQPCFYIACDVCISERVFVACAKGKKRDTTKVF